MTTRRKRSEIAEWSLRITPSDQNPIPSAEFLDTGLKDSELLIVCQEGEPNGTPRLHYHLYLKCNISRSTLERICAKIGRANSSVKGNAVFSIKQANAGTIGYVVKDRNVIASIGYDNHTLEEYFALSEQYRKDIESSRKRDSRRRETSLREIFDTLNITSETMPEDIITEVLDECTKRRMNFPSRSIMETNVYRLLYTHKAMLVRSFYMKNFEFKY